MSIEEKQNNEEFKVISMDPEVIKGDANKLKLLITSYAAIMEVQDAYMQEEIEAKKEAKRAEAQIASGNLTEAEVKSANEELATLTDQIRGLKEVYNKFSKSRTRFMDLAKKALRLPSANFEQLAEKGYTTISDEKIELSSLESSYETAQKTLTDEENVDVFSNINNEDIKKEIERVINEDVVTDDKTGEEKAYKDYIPNEVDSDKFDEVATKLATDAKKNIDIVKVGRKIFNDALTPADAAKSNDKITAEEAQTDHEDEQEYDEEVDTQTNIIPITVSFGDEDAATYEGNWAESDITKDDQEQEASNRHYTTLRQTGQNTEKTVDFNGDTAFQQFLASRQEGLNEKSNAISSLRTKVDTLAQTAKAKKAILEEEAEKSENAEADMALIEQKLEELKRLDEEEKRLSAQESELNEKQQKLNDEISEYDKQIGIIQQQNAAKLERYKAIQEEINKYIKGKTPDDDGQYGGAGGRRK